MGKGFVQVSEEREQLLQRFFQQMMEEVSDARVRNALIRCLYKYQDMEEFLNNPSLVIRWAGVGHKSVDAIVQFMEEFYQHYLDVAKGNTRKVVARLLIHDYPFLTDDDVSFVAEFLSIEGRFPVLFLAYCYFKHSTNHSVQIYARANGIVGPHVRYETIGKEFGLSRERVRQLSFMDVKKIGDAGLVWDEERWQPTGFLDRKLLTVENTDYAVLRVKERLYDLDFYAALTIIRQMNPVNTVALRADGRRANTRLSDEFPWQDPEVLFGYDSRLGGFSFEDALAVVGHEASLKRNTEKRMSLPALVDQHFKAEYSDNKRKGVMCIMKKILPLFSDVKTEGDDIVFLANKINYLEDIYQILQRRGQAMTVDEIYGEFSAMHPDDHHTDSRFIRSYMLSDSRFEAVGSKSTYQLREWKRFAGALGELAVYLLEGHDEPVKAEVLCRKMMEQRSNTTMKSCNTSIYIAVNAGKLMFYFDVEATEEAQGSSEVSRYYVGLCNRQYSERFWASPLSVEGAIRSMRRFLEEKGRWPFSKAKSSIESSLYYALRKYTQKRSVTKEELLRFKEGMADINRNEYPACERDLQFQSRCRELAAFCEQHHCLPTSGQLWKWYLPMRQTASMLSGFRKYEFKKLQSVISATRHSLSLNPSPQKPDSSEQLSLDFTE